MNKTISFSIIVISFISLFSPNFATLEKTDRDCLGFDREGKTSTEGEITSKYDILIPFTSNNKTIFDPSEISIPINTTVRWINLDSTPHNISMTKNDIIDINKQNSEIININKIKSVLQPLGGAFSYTFTNPGTYSYHDTKDKSSEGTIIVGDAIQKGDYLKMIIGANLPLKSSELKRIMFSFEPIPQTTSIDILKDRPIKYNFTISNPLGFHIYNKEIIDIDGRLDIEFIPIPSSIYVSSVVNTTPNTFKSNVVSEMKDVGNETEFTTWGFIENKNIDTINCLKDILHIRGPILVDFIKDGIKVSKPYSVQIDILSSNESKISPYEKYGDSFIIPTGFT